MRGAERLSRATLMAVACLGGTSCAAEQRLVDERTSPVYSQLVREDEALASRHFRIDVGSTGEAAWPVAIREITSPNELARTRPVLVLLNGVFSDGSTWRFVTGPLAKRFDLLVVDLPGTGDSAVFDPDAQPDDAFTLRWIGHRVWGALARWESAQQTQRPIVLIGHSLAGAAILRMLGDPTLRAEASHERSLSRGAILIGSADIGTASWSPVLIGLAKLTEPEVTIGGALGILRSEVEGGIIKSVEHPERTALEGEASRMVAVLEDRDQRRASQLMLRRIRPIDEHERPVWSAIRPMLADHARIDIPVMLLWGRDDDILPLPTGVKLESEIHGSHLVVIDGARHSVHQERPIAVVSAIERFVDGLSQPATARVAVTNATVTR